jgi:hypothetical protein
MGKKNAHVGGEPDNGREGSGQLSSVYCKTKSAANQLPISLFSVTVTLSPAAVAHLDLLATRTGLPPTTIVDALVRAADVQLVKVAARMHPGIIASGWRAGHVIPLQFFVAAANGEAYE